MHILIAEDDTHLRNGLSDLFTEEGYQCSPTENGVEALKLFEQNRPDFCIFDVMMPEMDGFELCRRVRIIDDEIPIILLTAKGDEVDRVVGLELGADDYVAKPFGPRELVARVRAITRRIAKEPNSSTINNRTFAMHDLDVNPNTMRANLGEKVIPLTKREMSVLSMLYQNKGKVIPRLELFEACWGRRYMTNSRALDQFISQLRQKVEHDPSNPKVIRTVHGIGYRYEEDS